MIFEIFQYGFMQRALVSGIAVAISCSVIGLFLVLRRQSLYGDALSHVAFGGIAVGLFANISPIWMAFIVSILASLGITKLRQSAKISADSAVAVLLSSGLAIGVVLIGLAGGFSLDLYSFLFGSILLISSQDQTMILTITAIVLIIMYKIYRKLMYIAFDEEQANVSGIDVAKLNYLFIVLASVTVITSLRLVGVLLISSLIVIQENSIDIHHHSSIVCNRRYSYFISYELGSRRNNRYHLCRWFSCNNNCKIYVQSD